MPKPIKDERSPYWQYDFQRNKRRFYGSTGCTAKRDAQRYIDNLLRKVALGDHDKEPITLDHACEVYWQQRGQHESNSATTEYQLANLCGRLGKDRFLSEIGQRDFQTYIAKRRGEVAPASVNREWQLARRVWKLALSSGYAVPREGDKNAITWKDLKLPEPKGRVRELIADEETRLFEKLPADLAAVVQFAVLSGQRKAAIVGLEWAKVDLQGRRATVTTKGDIEHTFPLSAEMVAIIQSRPAVQGCPYVFTYLCIRPSPARKDRPRRYKGQRYPFSVQGWDRQWRRAMAEAGIANLRFHDLRHTTATRIVRGSGNLKAAKELLGHTEIGTTARYAHVLEDDLRKIMDATHSRNSPGLALTDKAEKRRISKAKEISE